jgi:hypothetical protein
MHLHFFNPDIPDVLTTYLTFQIFKNSFPNSPPPSYYSNGAKSSPPAKGPKLPKAGKENERKKNSIQSSIVNRQSTIVNQTGE